MGEEHRVGPRPRIQSFSDLIFGLALSIGAIALIGNPPASVGDLEIDLATYAFNFLILISVWMRYTSIMSALPLETRRTVSLNTLLLFTVSIEPFLFNSVRSGNTITPVADALLQVSTSLYGLDLGVTMLVLGIFTLALADDEKKLVPKEMIRQLRSQAAVLLVAAAFFLVSALPLLNDVFVAGSFVRNDLWLGALLVIWISRGAMRLRVRPEGKET